MNPIYLDTHIHTSEDPNCLNENYDLDTLIRKIGEYTKDSKFLISITDHNVVNKKVYLEAKNKIENLLLGVELHIRNFDNAPFYHCHIYFNLEEITETIINDINDKLNILYPNKVVKNTDTNIPKLEAIIKQFDNYDFILLPHGGQTHSTFNKSIPKEDITFDDTLMRNIYYNLFDGFTARSNTGLEKTESYFKKLGINEFINLITCTDNYSPSNYPNPKAKEATAFVPTWMLAMPTFEGLRLSLSEKSRLVYGDKPDSWSEHIQKVTLNNSLIDIDVELTSGLNVVIGGSSSGKTLFVDSLYKKTDGDFSVTDYSKYGVEKIVVYNPSGKKPHYIYQNYITKILNSEENRIDQIEIVKKVFPGDAIIRNKIDAELKKLKEDLKKLIISVKQIQIDKKKLDAIPIFSKLITSEDIKKNALKSFIPDKFLIDKFEYDETSFNQDKQALDKIEEFLLQNPLIENHNPKLVVDLKEELTNAFEINEFEKIIRSIIKNEKKEVDNKLKTESNEQQTKSQDFEKLLQIITSYSNALIDFQKTIKDISCYAFKVGSEEVESMGHRLFIENEFSLNKEKFKEVICHFIKTKIDVFDEITPEHLFDSNHKLSPRVKDYADFENKIYGKFQELNKQTYKIIDNEGRKFENLSPGLKTSIILDIILGYEDDLAPLIIDQPEDNLATAYINEGLIKSVKKIKIKKQIIIVSHNATIPMLGDAQNIILCRNEDNKITIRSAGLEGKIDNKSIVDFVAEITDGGKSSIKKRVKKYNLKKFKEETK